MGRAEDLIKIERSMKDAEGRIKSMQTNISALDKELLNCSTLEKTINENVKYLKTKKIIAIAQEFKKAKEELKRLQSRNTILKNDREHYVRTLSEIETFLKDAQNEYNKLKNMTDSNILKFKGNKDGQK